MEKSERAELLRQRFRLKNKMPYVANGVRTVKPIDPPRSREVFPRWCRCEGANTERTPVWVKDAESKQDTSPRPKRASGESLLNKIAAKWASPDWRTHTKRLDLYHACR